MAMYFTNVALSFCLLAYVLRERGLHFQKENGNKQHDNFTKISFE